MVGSEGEPVDGGLGQERVGGHGEPFGGFPVQGPDRADAAEAFDSAERRERFASSLEGKADSELIDAADSCSRPSAPPA